MKLNKCSLYITYGFNFYNFFIYFKFHKSETWVINCGQRVLRRPETSATDKVAILNFVTPPSKRVDKCARADACRIFASLLAYNCLQNGEDSPSAYFFAVLDVLAERAVRQPFDGVEALMCNGECHLKWHFRDAKASLYHPRSAILSGMTKRFARRKTWKKGFLCPFNHKISGAESNKHRSSCCPTL